MYVFQLFDYYAASGMALLWVCFFECAAVAWVYGNRRYYDNLEYMLGYRLNPWLRICWTVLTPIITCVRHSTFCIKGIVDMYETVHFVNRNNDRKKDINYAELFALLTEFKMTLQADRLVVLFQCGIQ